MLQDIATSYLLHQYMVTLDKVFWAKFKSECPYPIIHIDYSENIKLTPKNEVQSSHFSGRQHTLHCCVLFNSNEEGDHKFIYHLSNDTNHDSIMTGSILEDILDRHPNIEWCIGIAFGQLQYAIQVPFCIWSNRKNS